MPPRRLNEVAWADRAPLQGFETGRCLRFPRQAQVHPLHYLAGLARVIVENGGRIFTSTPASSIEGGKDGARGRVGTGDDGPAVTAMDIVVATNSPINDRSRSTRAMLPHLRHRRAVRTAR